MPLIPEPEEIIKWEETALIHSLTLRFLEAGSPFKESFNNYAFDKIIYSEDKFN